MDGEVVGYLLGSMRENEWWQPHAWVGLAGHAAGEPEVVRDLYRFAAERWVDEEGASFTSPSCRRAELAEPWFRLAFATCRRTGSGRAAPSRGSLPARPHRPPGTIDDLRAAPALVTEIWEHHAGSDLHGADRAVLSRGSSPTGRPDLDGPGVAYFVAELDGRVVGHLLLEPEEPDLARPPGSIYLAVAATLPEARGPGAGVALTEHALGWAANAGYSAVHTDWRVANLESSRFWPRRGFRETFYRVARRVKIRHCPGWKVASAPTVQLGLLAIALPASPGGVR